MFVNLAGRDDPNGGIERGPLPFASMADQTRCAVLVCMFSVAMYQALVVDIQVFSTFKRRNSLYFFSLLIASTGIMSHSLGCILKWFVGACPWWLNTAFASFGWWAMVTGQSLVLYSRLHLVVRSQAVLRGVLVMILANFFIFQVVTTILTFGSNQANPGLWLTVYNIYERIQLCVFTLQESIISVIYIRAAIKMLKPSDPMDMQHTRNFLIYLNILCIVLDLAFVGEVFSGEWVYKTGTQSLAYGTKLTIEFVVLNRLMRVARRGPATYGHNPSNAGIDDTTALSGNKWSFKPIKGDKKRQGHSATRSQTKTQTKSEVDVGPPSGVSRMASRPGQARGFDAPWADTNTLTEIEEPRVVHVQTTITASETRLENPSDAENVDPPRTF